MLLTGNKSDDKPKENEQKEEEKKEEKEEEKEEEETTGNYELDIYAYEDDDIICGTYANYCNRKFLSIKTETKNPEYVSQEANRFILYFDNGLKLYDVNNKATKNISFEYDKKYNYQLVLNEAETRPIGIIYNNYTGYKDGGYYSIDSQKKLYTNINNLSYMRAVNDDYISITTDDEVLLASTKQDKIEITYKKSKEEYDSSFRSYGENGSYYYAIGECEAFCNYKELYSNSKKSIAKDVGQVSYYKGNIYTLKNNVVNEYNQDGEKVSSLAVAGTAEAIVENYLIYVKDNNLILYNLKDDSESVTLQSWKEQYFLDPAYTSYYTRKDLDEMNETNKKEGIYVVVDYGVQDPSTKYYGMEYCYNPTTKQLDKYPIKEMRGGRAKPVLYLYPTTDTKVDIKLAHPEYLTTTYPKYNNGWKVFAKPNGDLRDESGKYYYALYWDEKRYAEVDFSTGFYVTKENAIDFLEEKLTYIGLNDKERNEFIMYWLPILENNGKSLVYFELTEEREANNKLLVSPTPDSMLRVNIHIKKVNTKVDIKEEKLTSFERRGFTVVEWGGMTY